LTKQFYHLFTSDFTLWASNLFSQTRRQMWTNLQKTWASHRNLTCIRQTAV